MGLERVSDYTSHQAAAGGDRHGGAYLEQQVRGPIRSASRLIRNAADVAGGLVAVARNPVSAAYLRANAAIGALSQALAVGKHLCREIVRGADWVIQALKEQIGASLAGQGVVETFALKSSGGYDTGFVRAGGLELTIWNEYITLDESCARRATFPDLIVTIDLESGLPLTSGQLAVGRRIAVLAAPSGRIVLGAGLKAPENYVPLEAAVDREIIRFAFPAKEMVQ
jgi:uncharacterized protein